MFVCDDEQTCLKFFGIIEVIIKRLAGSVLTFEDEPATFFSKTQHPVAETLKSKEGKKLAQARTQ